MGMRDAVAVAVAEEAGHGHGQWDMAGNPFQFLWNIVTPITANKSFSHVRVCALSLSLSLFVTYELRLWLQATALD